MTNESAFPTLDYEREFDGDKLQLKLGEKGMTLRDYFAAKALVGMLAATDNNRPHVNQKEAAKIFYSMADAMLEARKEKT